MKTLSFFTFFLGLTFSFWADAQYNKIDSVWVLLETQNTFTIPKTTQPARPLQKNNVFQFKGIPMGLDTFLVYDADFQPRQGFHERFLRGEIDSTAYQKMTLRYRLKNKQLYQKPFKHQVHILSGRKNQQKIIICDANNNYDFGDDRMLIYDFKQKYQKFEPDSLENITVQYEYFLRNQIVKQTSILKIKPFDKTYRFPDSLQQDLSIFYSVAEHQVGSFTSDNKAFKIKIPFVQGSGGHDYTYGALFTLYDANDILINLNPILKLGDAYNLTAKERVKFQYISEMGDSVLVIKSNREQLEVGFREGEKMVSLNFKDINGTLYQQNQAKKYTLLDFWGTWCGPCIAGLPKLKQFYEKYQDKISLISVAYDKDKDKVKNFIENKGMVWLHKFESQDKSTTDDWVKVLNVPCFPTFMLIDTQSGEILLRDCGEDKLDKIADFLKNKGI